MKNLVTFKNINKKSRLMYPSNKTVWFLNWNYKRHNGAETVQVIFWVIEIWVAAFLLFYQKTDELSSSEVFICVLMGSYSASGDKGVSVNIRNVSSYLQNISLISALGLRVRFHSSIFFLYLSMLALNHFLQVEKWQISSTDRLILNSGNLILMVVSAHII